MRLSLTTLGAAALLSWINLVTVRAGRQAYDYMEIASQFAEDFLYPNNVAIVESGDYAAFDDDILGRVDITTTFPKKTLNVEYLFVSSGHYSRRHTVWMELTSPAFRPAGLV